MKNRSVQKLVDNGSIFRFVQPTEILLITDWTVSLGGSWFCLSEYCTTAVGMTPRQYSKNNGLNFVFIRLVI